MKILVVQLARFGDIYQSWPVLNALKRSHPQAEIHFLVRSRFKDACIGLDAVDRILELDTQSLLGPILEGESDLDTSIERVTQFSTSLCSENYTSVINLSFSPISSYLCHSLERQGAQILGYTRFSDGYLNIPDDASAYFYAQVGIGKSNRVHLTDIFSGVAGIDMSPDDWRVPERLLFSENIKKWMGDNFESDFYVVHIGASQRQKRISEKLWAEALSLASLGVGRKFVLVGASNEVGIAEEILKSTQGLDCINLVGKTELADLFALINQSQGLIGCDSVAIHMASLVGKRSLNISFMTVNFWETGPKAQGSRVVLGMDPLSIAPQRVADEIRNFVFDLPMSGAGALRIEDEINPEDPVSYELQNLSMDNFKWDLVRSVYMDCDFPELPLAAKEREQIQSGVVELLRTIDLALEQLVLISDPNKGPMASSILDRVDEVISGIEKLVPSLQPLIAWFQVERLRIPPGSLKVVQSHTQSLFRKFALVLQVFEDREELTEFDMGEMNDQQELDK